MALFWGNFSHQTCDQIIMILILPPFTFNENLDNKPNIYTEVDDWVMKNCIMFSKYEFAFDISFIICSQCE